MNEQEKFWAGAFGDEYIDRNSFDYMPSKIHFMTKIVEKCSKLESVLELGANIGLNLVALTMLIPGIRRTAVEINEKACKILTANAAVDYVINRPILEFESNAVQHDLVLVSGVLIHQNPETLPAVYDIIAESSSKYVCLAEYYNPVPIAIPYRGHEDKLFKRDFAGEFMDQHPEFEMVAYEFMYHRDPNFPIDDATWFLMQRKN